MNNKQQSRITELENPNEVANKILNEYLEGKSFGFIKEVINYIDLQLDIICKTPISKVIPV